MAAHDSTIPEGEALDPITEFLAHKRAQGRRSATITSYSYALDKLRAWYSGDVQAIDKLTARRYVRDLQGRYTPAGASSLLGAIKSFFSWCCEEEILEASPFRKISVETPEDPRQRPPPSRWKRCSRGPASRALGLGSETWRS